MGCFVLEVCEGEESKVVTEAQRGSFGLLGELREANWGPLGASWGYLATSWGPLASLLGALGGVLGHLVSLVGR